MGHANVTPIEFAKRKQLIPKLSGTEGVVLSRRRMEK